MLFYPRQTDNRVNHCSSRLTTSHVVSYRKLTHSDDISPGVIHALIVLGCPIKANLDNALESPMVSGKFFPTGHENFKRRNDPRQDGSTLPRHHLLHLVRDLNHQAWKIKLWRMSECQKSLTSNIISKSCKTDHSIDVSLCFASSSLGG